MILFLNKNAPLNEIENLRERLHSMGFETTLEIEDNHKVIAIINGVDSSVCLSLFENFPFVEKVAPFNNQFKLVGKDIRKNKSVIQINGLDIGRDEFIVMAGPCTIESREQIFSIAKKVSQDGATVLRGGAFKPRTSPYDFQGLGEQGLKFLRDAADAFGLLCVSEVMSTDDVALVEKYVDILQLGARNMQNYSLLKAVGKARKPVLLKRGLSATYKEFLSAAEYIMSAGNPHVILCERGIRTFETYSRNTLDIAAVPLLRELTHLPIIIDPSHGVGLRSAVPPMANAAIAVQADGMIVEVHTTPDESISDAAQTISTATFSDMMCTLRKIGAALNMHVKEVQCDAL
ncbi:MAG: 3-deoxy-7-phosphoheptulonate synthase [Gammaproteobacteria bacterium]|nr:3-deoxy-7-phosphoheptulonate synthase [Gammaproteobacteria bacterium]MCH9763350.1 3-deoxy-7-phosphoheptulonate synthase [Gammaproteobacteria bacterium]